LKKRSKKRPLPAGRGPACFKSHQKQKFFCFFFYKKRSAFFLLFLIPLPALAYDNSACWHYAEQQGPRPDITCTSITPALLQSLQDATQAQIVALMNEPGMAYPDGTVHYTGNDLNNDGGYQGVIALSFSAGQVTAISARLDNPNQGGAYFTYRWTEGGSACSDLPGSQKPC
jgi:hypothetical protein